MPDRPTLPEPTGGQQRFRADLLAYLDSLSVHELADLLGELPSSRQEPLQLGVLMVAMNELLPPAGQPGPGEGRRRSLREVVADRRAARAARRAGPPGATLEDWLRTRPHGRPPATDPAVERRLGEAPCGHATQRGEREEQAAMAWEDPGRPREPEPPAQGWRDWWLCDDEHRP
jgi:hypothetical protein